MTEQNETNFFQRTLLTIRTRKLWPYLAAGLLILSLGIYLIVQAAAGPPAGIGGDDPTRGTSVSANQTDDQGAVSDGGTGLTATLGDGDLVQGSPTYTRRPTSTDPPRSFRTFTPTWDGTVTATPFGWTASPTRTAAPTATNTPVGWTASPTRTATNTPAGWTPSPTRTPTSTPVLSALTVQISLTANQTSINEPGGLITFTVKVTNTFSSPVALLSLTDSVIADLSKKGTCNQTGNLYPTALAPGASYTCTYSVNFLGDPEDIYQNTVTVQVEDTFGRTATASDGALVEIIDLLPSFTVSKTASAASVIEPGEIVTFTIEITNTSVEPLLLIQILDDRIGNLNGIGSCDSGQNIPVGGTYSCEFATVVTGIGGDSYTNIVSARLMDDEYNALTKTAEATVKVLPAGASTISGQVRFDEDGDGNMADPDPGLPGVEIELQDVYCTPGVNCPVEITGDDGRYTFSSVSAGSYFIVATDLPNYFSTNDSAPPNDNQIPLMVEADRDYPNNDFIDSTCPSPDPVNGFVSATVPSDNQVVSLTLATIKVDFNQAMSQSGAGSVLDMENYQNGLANLTSGGTVPFIGISYDANTDTVSLAIDTNDPDWLPGLEYELEILSQVENSCGEPQGVDVARSFYTMSAVSGQVRLDTDGDGDLGDDDLGLSGVTIELDDGACLLGTNCRTAVTDSGGEYLFTDLTVGNYVIHEIDLAGYDSTNDADGGNFNQISVTSLGASEVISDLDFLDKVGCSNPNPVSGFVSSTIPTNLQTDVVLSANRLVVVFNQPMIESGTGSVGDVRNYSLRNTTAGRPVNLSGVTYNAATYTAYVTVNTSSRYWEAGDWYVFVIESGLQNSCGVAQMVDVEIRFQTAQ